LEGDIKINTREGEVKLKMAKKDKKESKKVLERSYNVPLRKEYLKAPNWKRTPKAVRALRAFITRHTKSDNIKLGKYLNNFMWKNGIKNPPHHVKINIVKTEDGLVKAELVGAPKEEPLIPKKPAKEEEPKKPKLDELGRLEEKKEEKSEKAKEIEKEERKEIQKEHPKVHAPKQPKAPKNVERHPTGPKSQ
jgi:large subunit ribosomal protein L31e